MNRKYVAIVPLCFIAALILYKTVGSIAVFSTVSNSGVMASRPTVVALGAEFARIDPVQRTFNYLIVIWPALVFGILISAAVRTFVSKTWMMRSFGSHTASPKVQVKAGLAGAPLMLCSCCVAPVFSSMVETSARVGPALAVLLASPSLNPAALIFTFLLFRPEVAFGRLAMALTVVFLSGGIIERLFQKSSNLGPPPQNLPGDEPADGIIVPFAIAVASVSIRTVPVLIVGIIGSMLLVEWLPPNLFDSPASGLMAVFAAATIAVPLALPTFLEIPIALGLLAAGFPAGAAAAFLFAGPAVNLPSLLTVGRRAGWKIASALAVFVWVIAVVGGIIVG